MENRKVGYLIIGIALIIGLIILLFNSSLKSIVSASCSHGPTCSMYGSINTQTWISLAILVILIILGLILIFSKEKEKVIVRTKKIRDEVAEAKKEERKTNLKLLSNEEKVLYSFLLEDGSMFQSDLVDKSRFGKVKVSRLLDNLEAKQLIERKRRGMTNIVILK